MLNNSSSFFMFCVFLMLSFCLQGWPAQIFLFFLFTFLCLGLLKEISRKSGLSLFLSLSLLLSLSLPLSLTFSLSLSFPSSLSFWWEPAERGRERQVCRREPKCHSRGLQLQATGKYDNYWNTPADNVNYHHDNNTVVGDDYNDNHSTVRDDDYHDDHSTVVASTLMMVTMRMKIRPATGNKLKFKRMEKKS